MNSSLNREMWQRAGRRSVELIYSKVFEARPPAVAVSLTIDHRVQRKRGWVSTNIHFLRRKSNVSLRLHDGLLPTSPPLLHWLFTHYSYRQDLVPRSPARVYLWPTVSSEISARISLQICSSILGGILAVAFLQATILHSRVLWNFIWEFHIKSMPANAAIQS